MKSSRNKQTAARKARRTSHAEAELCKRYVAYRFPTAAEIDAGADRWADMVCVGSAHLHEEAILMLPDGLGQVDDTTSAGDVFTYLADDDPVVVSRDLQREAVRLALDLGIPMREGESAEAFILRMKDKEDTV